jgi:hypothetical protein
MHMQPLDKPFVGILEISVINCTYIDGVGYLKKILARYSLNPERPVRTCCIKHVHLNVRRHSVALE